MQLKFNGLFLFLFLFSCQQSQPKPEQLSLPNEPSSVSKDAGSTNEKLERKIIKTAQYKIQVKDVEVSSHTIKRVVLEKGGYISEMNMTNFQGQKNNVFTIRVSDENFESLLESIGNEAIYTNYKKIETQDVSEEFIDIQSRLKTKKQVRDRYEEILRTKATTVKEVLMAEEQIRVLQEEIEAKEGRLRFLENQVSLNTLHLGIYQIIEVNHHEQFASPSFWAKAGNNFAQGWGLIKEISLLFIQLWPIFLIIGGILFWKRSKIFKPKHQ